MAAKLKTYATRIDGLHEWIVAAPNQAAALEAWGVSQNLFQQGTADVTDATDAVTAALAKPGVALRRMAGSKGAFVPAAADSGAEGWSAAARAAGVSAAKMKRASTPKPRPDTAKLDAAKQALADFEADAERRLAEFEARRKSLDEEARRTEGDISRRRSDLRAAMDRAR